MVQSKINKKSVFVEHKLQGRSKLAFEWLNDNNNRILDAGCSYGYMTCHYAKKSNETYGIDINNEHIEQAKILYPQHDFRVDYLENLSFEDNFFDSIVFTDVLEHTQDKVKSLSELYRVLKPGGEIIISTPHKSLFGFLDPYNYGYYLQKYLSPLYKSLYKVIRLIKEGKLPSTFNPVHKEKHFHYNLAELKEMLNKSDFGSNYQIVRIKRSGLLLEPIALNMDVLSGITLKGKLHHLFNLPFKALGHADYAISYGCLAYNIAIKVKKLK